MSTATVHHQHRFSHPIAMAAATTVVVIGAVTAFGIASSHDGSSIDPVAPAPHGHSGTGHSPQFTLKGGHTMTGRL
jgi:hypothetical protein